VSALLQLAVVTIPFLQPLFKVTPVAFAWEWGAIAMLALAPVTVIEIVKLLRAGIMRAQARRANDEANS
jgi:hypothetical protein